VPSSIEHELLQRTQEDLEEQRRRNTELQVLLDDRDAEVESARAGAEAAKNEEREAGRRVSREQTELRRVENELREALDELKRSEHATREAISSARDA